MLRKDGTVYQKELCDNRFLEELLRGVPVIEEANGIMPGSGAKDWENRKV